MLLEQRFQTAHKGLIINTQSKIPKFYPQYHSPMGFLDVYG